MSVIGSNILAGASAGAAGAADYTIQRSLRFNDDDTPSLNRTFAAGNRSAWTWSAWFKFSDSGTQYFLTTTNSSINDAMYLYTANGALVYWDRYQSTRGVVLQTNRVFRDTSAWYHIVLVADYANATSTDRARLYINGVRETSFASSNYPNTTEQSYVNAAVAHYIGAAPVYLNGYLAENHFIDGQALEATDFGKFDENTGVWNPIRYTGTYGTNGYYLKFNDNTSTTTLGEDASGNSNDWTLNNFSVASGAGNDSLIDTPTNYTASSGNNGGNYCTWNLLDKDADVTLSNGNLDFTQSNPGVVRGTIAVTSGKWYWEIKKGGSNAYQAFGISTTTAELGTFVGGFTGSASLYGSGYLYTKTGDTEFTKTSTSQLTTLAAGDVIGIALDLDSATKTVKWYKNGTLLTAGHVEITSTDPIAPCMGTNIADTGVCNANFGQRQFEYTPPTDHLPLCTTNLPDPTIEDGSTVMDIALYTGTGSTQTITGLNFSPDFVWLKNRTVANSHGLFDAVRGAEKRLKSDATDAEQATTNHLTAFNSDGFSLGGSTYNRSGENLVAWSWDAGANSSKTFTVKVVSDSGNKYRFDDFGTSAVTLDLEEGSTYVFDQSDSSNATHPLRFSTTSDGTHGSGSEYTTGVTTTGTPGSSGAKTTITVASGAPTLYYYCSAHSGMGGQANTNSTAGASNFDGGTQSTVRANTSAGFSIVTYTGNGTFGATVGHGLNQAPGLVIYKNRDSTLFWVVYHQEVGATQYLVLNSTGVSATSTSAFNDTAPTSSLLTLGNGTTLNENGSGIVAYCFAPVSGYSAFAQYTGNGSTDGPFVYTGFRPAFVMIKSTTSATNWVIQDTTRSTYNPEVASLYPSGTNAEYTGTAHIVDYLSNGFKVRSTDGIFNTSSQTYIYAAFAEHPLSLNGGLAR